MERGGKEAEGEDESESENDLCQCQCESNEKEIGNRAAAFDDTAGRQAGRLVLARKEGRKSCPVDGGSRRRRRRAGGYGGIGF